MRFMEFVKLHCLPCGSLFNEGRGVADAFATVHEVRHVLCRLFDASSRADAARSARDAYKAARERLDALEDAARQPSASTFERHMRRSGLDAAFRKVDALIQRRGMKLKEVCELLDQDGEGRCDSSRLAAFLQAVGVRKPPPSYEIARRKHAEREAAAAAAAAERRREEADFAARMRAAEESGCVASFALMDRYFSRYQLKAEDIWTHGRAKKTTGLDRAAESHEDDSDAVGPDEFHRMLQTAKVHLSSEQVARLVAYLDTDGSGKIEHRELQAAMLDYRRFKRAKQRLELQRAERERRLFLDRQVLVLLQYLVLVGGARDAPGDAGEDQSEQFIEVAEFQRAIGRASHLPIAQYLRGIRERLHSGAYRGLAELRSSAAT
jgi:Ca2+-binding EF-hand superfamily protein